MQEYMPNFWALLGATAAKFAFGALWYSPILFLSAWMKEAGVKESQMKEGMPKAMVSELIGNLVMAFVLAHAIHYAHPTALPFALAVGFFNWIGFALTSQMGGVFYEGKSFKWLLINSSYLLVAYLLMSGILYTWAG